MAETREGTLDLAAGAGPPDLGHHRLAHGEHVILVHERHLEVELRELGLPIVAQVLVAQAAGDLEVAVEARHHQDLLVELRRLRQRVELALAHPARRQVVARPLRRRSRQDGGLDLDEIQPVERVADRLKDPVPRAKAALNLGPPQIQVAVAEPQLFGGQLFVGAVGHRDGRGLGRRQQRQLARSDFDRAGGQVGVHGVIGARHDVTLHRDDRLGAEAPRPLPTVGVQLLRTAGDLHRAGEVAEIDEDEAAQIAPPVHPAGQAHTLAHVLGPQLARQVRSIGCPVEGIRHELHAR